MGGNGLGWTRVVRRDIELKYVVRGCLAFIRGRDVGMFCAYWMEPKYGIGHFIEQYDKDLRANCRGVDGWRASRMGVDYAGNGSQTMAAGFTRGIRPGFSENRLK